MAPGRYRPGAPTDPYVRALPHTVLRSTDSPSAMVPEAIRSSDGDMLIEPRCARHVSLNRVCRPTLRFPPQGPPGRVPLLQQYYQSATTSCRPSRRASLPSLGGTSRVHSFFSLPDGRVRRRGLELVTRYLRPGFRRGSERISQVPGESQSSVCTCSSTPAGLLTPDHYGAATRPLVRVKQRLPQLDFRRSIAWLSNSLSTLRSADYSNPTQDSLPAAGQALPDGLLTRKIPLKGFRFVSLHLILPSQASWHKHALRCALKVNGPLADVIVSITCAEYSEVAS